ncbi:cupin domain-containing protein [Paenibacillus sp. IB182496]|uniref:Cupin domain-containing protein n=1 Tax=Paenibacillus sabuli TaxID=2772509 RepID=A0A927GUD8_9BACL|nr:sugar phosphate nucleotidyltransferase [Paenibacillus sabuli]MBD2848568.1 cupin domain-containing protein [Paenibacillus sabuli]
MRVVLLSGGSGKRLWPLSNDARSKQFLKVLEDPSGMPESMVQRVWRQLGAAGLQQQAYIATSRSQVEVLTGQLGGAPRLVVEPARRDTFAAIALAATYLYAIEGASLGETIVVMPVDPYVEADFFGRLQELDRALEETSAELALIGVRPTYSSEKYGYIQPVGSRIAEASSGPLAVGQFREKPSETEAERLIAEGALWNCGVFAFKLDYLINLLIAMDLPIQYEEMARQYAKLPAISFDYQVAEQVKQAVVLPYEGPWRDLGTWNTLSGEMKHRIVGKGVVSADSVRTHLINELDIPVAVLGLPDAMVVTSPDGILVSSKTASPRIKELVGALEGRPMYEERRWGHYRVIDHVTYDGGAQVLTKRIWVRAGCNLSYQYHDKRSEVWTILSGEGECVLDGRILAVRPGDVLQIPRGSRHSVRAASDLEFIEVQRGGELVEEDITRLRMTWPEIVDGCTRTA